MIQIGNNLSQLPAGNVFVRKRTSCKQINLNSQENISYHLMYDLK